MELLASRLFLFAPAFLDLQAFQSFGTLELNPMQAPGSLAIADVSSPDHGDSANSIAYILATGKPSVNSKCYHFRYRTAIGKRICIKRLTLYVGFESSNGLDAQVKRGWQYPAGR